MNSVPDKVVPLTFLAGLILFMFGLGGTLWNYTTQEKQRFEQCIAADMQWVHGVCIK